METSTRHILTIAFLIAVLTAPYICVELWYFAQQRKIHSEVSHIIEDGLNKNQLTLLTFSLNEEKKLVHWKKNDEFEYNGAMYDVVKSQTDGYKTKYTCWKDEKELHLKKQWKKLMRFATQSKQENKDEQKKLVDHFKTLFLDQFYKCFAQAQYFSTILIPYTKLYTSRFLNTPNPPP